MRVFALSICFRIKRILRSLHKTTAPQWYECAKILAALSLPLSLTIDTTTHKLSCFRHTLATVSLPLTFRHFLVWALFYELVFPFFIHIYHILLVQSNHSVEMCWCFFLFDLVTSFVDVLFEIVSMIEVSHLANGILLTPMGLVNKTASPFLSFFPVDGSQCMQFDQKPTDRQLPMCLVSSKRVFRQIESRDILSSVHELFPR